MQRYHGPDWNDKIWYHTNRKPVTTGGRTSSVAPVMGRKTGARFQAMSSCTPLLCAVPLARQQALSVWLTTPTTVHTSLMVT